LSLRPRSMESADSQQTHQYGMLMTSNGKSKPTMLAMIQSWVLDEADECWFPQIIDGCSEYDTEQKDSDWDEVDALGLALVRDIDMKQSIKRTDKKEEDDFLADRNQRWSEQVLEARERHEDFDDLVFESGFPKTEVMMNTIMDSEVGAKVGDTLFPEDRLLLSHWAGLFHFTLS